MWSYFELLSFESATTVARWQREVAEGLNPRDVKYTLAHEITARFHGEAAAGGAQAGFVARFQKGALPEDLPEVRLDSVNGMAIANLLKEAGLVASTSEALRLLGQGAVRIDGERVEDRALLIKSGTSQVVQVGKRRAARVTVG
jgi:tyrosyl-tRNA synthetase